MTKKNCRNIKWGIFPMVIWPEFRMVEYWDDDHHEDAPQFTQGRFKFLPSASSKIEKSSSLVQLVLETINFAPDFTFSRSG